MTENNRENRCLIRVHPCSSVAMLGFSEIPCGYGRFCRVPSGFRGFFKHADRFSTANCGKSVGNQDHLGGRPARIPPVDDLEKTFIRHICSDINHMIAMPIVGDSRTFFQECGGKCCKVVAGGVNFPPSDWHVGLEGLGLRA